MFVHQGIDDCRKFIVQVFAAPRPKRRGRWRRRSTDSADQRTEGGLRRESPIQEEAADKKGVDELKHQNRRQEEKSANHTAKQEGAATAVIVVTNIIITSGSGRRPRARDRTRRAEAIARWFKDQVLTQGCRENVSEDGGEE